VCDTHCHRMRSVRMPPGLGSPHFPGRSRGGAALRVAPCPGCEVRHVAIRPENQPSIAARERCSTSPTGLPASPSHPSACAKGREPALSFVGLRVRRLIGTIRLWPVSAARAGRRCCSPARGPPRLPPARDRLRADARRSARRAWRATARSFWSATPLLPAFGFTAAGTAALSMPAR